jgi:Gram-negative bacterial TonB protein C-terminal
MEAATPKSEKDWIAYVQRSVNVELANKYLKIPKGEQSVKQTVLMEFVITRFGTIGEVKVTNAEEVHPALAKEAIRVIKEGYGWKPATFNGKAIEGLARQPVTFLSSY